MKQIGAFKPHGTLAKTAAINTLATTNVATAFTMRSSNGAKMLMPKYHQMGGSKYFVLFGFLFFIMDIVVTTVTANDEINGGNNDITNGYSLGPEITTTEFDYASRGSKKFGDKCESTLECGFPGSICHPQMKYCQCVEDLPVTNHIDKCGKEVAVNDTCFFNEQCEAFTFQTECRDGRCICRFEMSPIFHKDGSIECKAIKQESRETERYIDPAMIGILAGMALMFIIICVVLRLFSRARWRENRTIFNTPNPRLMNVSLLRDNKLLHGQERRGSRMSVRLPSRQPSMASLRPHSPNPSLEGSRRGSRGSSNASATSTKSIVGASGNSGQHHHLTASSTGGHHEHKNIKAHITNIPVIECVTVEVTEPKA